MSLAASACGGAGNPASIASPSRAASSPTIAIGATAIPATPSPVSFLAIDDLPHVELADVDATAVCDPEPRQANPDARESTIHCADGLELAIAAVRTRTKAQVARVFLHRPGCAGSSCSDDELNTATVTVWTAAGAFLVRLDARLDTVPVPTVTNDVAWPSPGTEAVPEVARPPIKGAPGELTHRDPYPFCGRAELGEPPEVLGCFRSAVLSGTRAEMIEQVYGTEGGAMLLVSRYAGMGRLIRYYHDQTVGGDGQQAESWSLAEGGMILGITPLAWDFEPWWGTEQRL